MLRPHRFTSFLGPLPSLDCPFSSTSFSGILILSSAFPSSKGPLRKKPDPSFIPQLHGVNLNHCATSLRGACVLSFITLCEMKPFVPCSRNFRHQGATRKELEGAGGR